MKIMNKRDYDYRRSTRIRVKRLIIGPVTGDRMILSGALPFSRHVSNHFCFWVRLSAVSKPKFSGIKSSSTVLVLLW